MRNQSMNFYRKCIENKLGLEEFRFKQDGTSQLKLAALPVLMDITKITKITGDYNNVRPYLFVDKVMGGVNFCLGLSREDNVYVPSKSVDADIYSTVKHVAKGLNLNNITLPQEINAMINLDNYIYRGK